MGSDFEKKNRNQISQTPKNKERVLTKNKRQGEKRMKRGKTKEEENCKNHANDVIILQWSNTALGNRLDHFKRTLEQMKQSDQNLQNLCGCYEFFFSSFFSGWKTFLSKLERLNQFVKKQEGAERHIQKFKQIFEGIDELSLIMNKFKETACVDDNKQDCGNEKTKNISQSIQGRQQQLIDIQKLTKTRVEGFLKVFESIYTDTVIGMSAQDEKMAEAIKNLVSSNDQNETTRKLYKENTQLQARLKELEQLLTKDISLVDTEKDFLMNNFAAQSKTIKDLQIKLAEEKELSERLSLRLRHKMDYSFISINHKTGQQQPDAATVLTQIQEGASAILEDKKMEIEEQGGNLSPTQFFSVNKKGYECVCGGVQVEYTRQKFEDALKKMTDFKPLVISACASTLTQQDSVGGLNGVPSSLGIIAPQNSIACNVEGDSQIVFAAGETREARGVTIEIEGIKNDEIFPSAALIESEKRVTIEEKIVLLSKQKDQLIEESAQQEKVIREMELEMKNIEEKFFHSGVYQSLVSQVQELARMAITQRNQLREAKFLLEGIEKLRQREIQDLLTKFNEEKTQLMKEAQDAKEGVLQENLGQIIRNNLEQHFNYKKYTTPLEDQIAKLSESLEIQRQHCQSLEEQKQVSQKAALDQQKTISDLTNQLHEREQTILALESQSPDEKSLSNKTFKYAKHKEIILSVEKLLSNLQGQQQQEDILKNFRELMLYLKSREEKVNMYEAKLKQSETERKKMQSSIDQIWQDYESLDTGFTKLKKANDVQIAELKLHAEKEQDLETKNLEIMMKYEKEQHAQKILLQSEQSKREATKQLIDAMTEQNKILSQQNLESVQLLEEVRNMNTSLKQELEQANTAFVESQQRQKLAQKKQIEINAVYQELILDHERTKAKLQNAYDVLENIDNKELNSGKNKNQRKTNAEEATLSVEQEQIRNLTSLLQCQCGERIKDTILYKCLHPFCRPCIDKQLKTRQRTCPKCRTPFGNSDIKTLYLSN